ncbi:hypothetical protein EFL99_04140 [Lactococcus lactis]|uniref:hypothetical protein n=1 Tax=Lactococcus lactis TaxID=1358 RepID=UPI00223B138A|nr:hypothetical protein [Lactococcus lactis]MCT1182474.1 hypothetical protein [Lactococcus lactis]
MKKIFDILYVKEVKISESKLQIELENIVKIDDLFWSKNSLTPSFKIAENSFEISGKVITIFINDNGIEPFIRYYLIAKIEGVVWRFYQRNYEEHPRALRYYDLGIGSQGDLHKVIYINDFGNIGFKIVPQIILDTFDRRLPINVELTDISTGFSSINIKVSLEWPNESWKTEGKIIAFITELNSSTDNKIYAVESVSKIKEKEGEINAKFSELSNLRKDKDYAFGIEIGLKNNRYSLLTTRVSKKLFYDFYPFFRGINLIPDDNIEFKITKNTAITICRKISFVQAGTSPSFANEFESVKFLSRVEREYLDEAYKTLENEWIKQAAYHNFLGRGNK